MSDSKRPPIPRAITYDDILNSLSMKVENGKLVITRDTNKENFRAGIQPTQQQIQQQKEQQQKQIEQQQQQTKLRNDKLLTNLRNQLDEKKRTRESKNNKLFLNQQIKCSNQRVQMNI
jgi:hypothetical protein